MEDQDGGAGSLGTIGAHNHMDGSRLHQAPPDRRADGWADNCPCVVVEWDHGGAFYYLTYRTGPDSAAAPFGGDAGTTLARPQTHRSLLGAIFLVIPASASLSCRR